MQGYEECETGQASKIRRGWGAACYCSLTSFGVALYEQVGHCPWWVVRSSQAVLTTGALHCLLGHMRRSPCRGVVGERGVRGVGGRHTSERLNVFGTAVMGAKNEERKFRSGHATLLRGGGANT